MIMSCNDRKCDRIEHETTLIVQVLGHIMGFHSGNLNYYFM